MIDITRMWPRCAVCDAPVEKMTAGRDPLRCKTVYTVACHGQTETMEIDDSVMVTMRSIGPGAAFATPRLPEGAAP
jgi:hypothetical protein